MVKSSDIGLTPDEFQMLPNNVIKALDRMQSRPMLTTKQAAEQLQTSRRIVQRLIAQGRLKATKYGRDYLINPRDLDAVRNRPSGKHRP
jgi:excisionase family DNA binding protein